MLPCTIQMGTFEIEKQVHREREKHMFPQIKTYHPPSLSSDSVHNSKTANNVNKQSRVNNVSSSGHTRTSAHAQ